MEQNTNKNTPEYESQALTDKLTELYPWYDIPYLQKYRTEHSALPPRLNLLARFRPEILFATDETATTDMFVSAVPAGTATEENPAVNIPTTENSSDIFALIDKFLEEGDHKISIAESTTDEFIAQPDKLPEGALLTEELASVYVKQGLYQPAIEIYKGLSLLNPEKSVYFAKLIADLETRTVDKQTK